MPALPCGRLFSLCQVLVVSDMHRTESAMDPSLFQYEQHFESPWQLVGKTHLSEVGALPSRRVGCMAVLNAGARLEASAVPTW